MASCFLQGNCGFVWIVGIITRNVWIVWKLIKEMWKCSKLREARSTVQQFTQPWPWVTQLLLKVSLSFYTYTTLFSSIVFIYPPHISVISVKPYAKLNLFNFFNPHNKKTHVILRPIFCFFLFLILFASLNWVPLGNGEHSVKIRLASHRQRRRGFQNK